MVASTHRLHWSMNGDQRRAHDAEQLPGTLFAPHPFAPQQRSWNSAAKPSNVGWQPSCATV
jgi:hypothetical protein